MNLIKALKTKKKLIGRITTLKSRLITNNVYEEGQEVPYDAKDALTDYIQASKDLIELKTKIHLANAPIYVDIFKMSELKDIVSQLKSLNTTSGKRKGYNQDVSIMIATIGTIERDQLVADFENEIEELQEKIETFNSKTII